LQVGIHIIADLKKCNKRKLNDINFIEKLLYKASEFANAKPMGIKTVKFEPQGLSSVLIIAESHISVHTYPELEYCAVDIFTCGKNAKPLKAFGYIKKELECEEYRIQVVNRKI
jgi:S-adenosylmethionine decarboxylase